MAVYILNVENTAVADAAAAIICGGMLSEDKSVNLCLRNLSISTKCVFCHGKSSFIIQKQICLSLYLFYFILFDFISFYTARASGDLSIHTLVQLLVLKLLSLLLMSLCCRRCCCHRRRRINALSHHLTRSSRLTFCVCLCAHKYILPSTHILFLYFASCVQSCVKRIHFYFDENIQREEKKQQQ